MQGQDCVLQAMGWGGDVERLKQQALFQGTSSIIRASCEPESSSGFLQPPKSGPEECKA